MSLRMERKRKAHALAFASLAMTVNIFAHLLKLDRANIVFNLLQNSLLENS